MGRVSRIPSPAERLRALGAAVTIGTDRTGGDQSAAQTLLTEAATFGAQARAGWRPQMRSGALPVCPDDDRPVAPDGASAMLRRLLGDPDPPLIEEWAQLAVAHGVRVDGATAPLLLDWWARQRRPSETVFTALGHRGTWLASLNTDWQKQVAALGLTDDVGEVWQAGKSPERQAMLIAVRLRDPAKALSLVESTWKSDGANDRQRFMELLRLNISMADEPFLEAALDDRSKVVRREAAALLARIPGSRLRQRLAEAAKDMIAVRTVRAKLIGRSRQQIVLVPPESFHASWDRDGIEERPAQGVGPRAWWMRQVLARADLAVWNTLTGLAPEAILESLKDDDYFDEAVHGLKEAGQSGGDPVWTTGLVRWQRNQTSIDLHSIEMLFFGLPHDQYESLSLETATKGSLTPDGRWRILTAMDRAWSPAFSTAAMAILSTQVSKDLDGIFYISQAIEVASRCMSPDAPEIFAEAVTRAFLGSPDDKALKHIERVRLRADMHKEFRS
jgi:Family of unknown function (DUF5691)